MLLATLVNPYGLALHRQAFAHVSWASTGRFVEFRARTSVAGRGDRILRAPPSRRDRVRRQRRGQPTWGRRVAGATLHLALTAPAT
jgi:hypothetical protein